MRVEKKGDFGRCTESGCANCEEAQEADEGSKNDAGILVEGPLKEAELGGPELDPIKEHIWVAEVGGSGAASQLVQILGGQGVGVRV